MWIAYPILLSADNKILHYNIAYFAGFVHRWVLCNFEFSIKELFLALPGGRKILHILSKADNIGVTMTKG
jgi:hypothetical protein